MREKLLKGTLLFASGQIVFPILNLVAIAIVVRALGKEQYGVVALALSLYSIGSMIMDLGFRSWMVSELARYLGQDRMGAAHSLLRLMTVYEGVSSVAIAAIIGVVAGFDAHISTAGQWIIVAYILITPVQHFLTTILYAWSRFAPMQMFALLESCIRLALVAGLFLFGSLTSDLALATYPFALLVSALCVIPATWPLVRQVLSAPAESINASALRRQGTHVLLGGAVRAVRTNAPVWLINDALGIAAVAVYSVASRAFAVVVMLFRALESAVFPAMSELVGRTGGADRAIQLGEKAVKYSLIIALATLPFAYALSPWGIRVVFGAQFLESVTLFRLMLFALPFVTLMHVQRPLYFSIRRADLLFACYTAASVLSLAALWVALRVWGLAGGAIETIVFYITVVILGHLLLSRAGARLRLGHMLRLRFADVGEMVGMLQPAMRFFTSASQRAR